MKFIPIYGVEQIKKPVITYRLLKKLGKVLIFSFEEIAVQVKL
jgi:hypothetical protein